MVGINSTRDDAGIQSLIRENKQDTATKAVSPTEAILRVRAAGEPQPRVEQRQEVPPEYQGPDRRSGRDRRHNKRRNPLLDTRSNRERRRNFSPEETADDDIPVRGIDVKI